MLHPPAVMLEPRDALIGIVFEPISSLSGQYSLLLWGSSFITSFLLPNQTDIDALQAEAAGVKRTADDSTVSFRRRTSFSNVAMKRKYRDLIGVEFMKYGEMVVVERPFIDLLPSLPPAFYSRTYGNM